MVQHLEYSKEAVALLRDLDAVENPVTPSDDACNKAVAEERKRILGILSDMVYANERMKESLPSHQVSESNGWTLGLQAAMRSIMKTNG